MGSPSPQRATRVLTATIDRFLSVVPNTILTHELGWHHSTIGVPDGRDPFFRLHGSPAQRPQLLVHEERCSCSVEGTV
jgi:hypothetical protein